MAYTTEAKVENLFGIDISGGGSAAMTDIIAAVKAWIDSYCGKTFEAASATKYYDGNGMKNLLIDAFIGSPTVSIISLDGNEENALTEGRDDDYITSPYNETEKNELILTGFGKYCHFPKGIQRVKVVASFGASSSVPADIQLVATKLAGQMFQDPNEGILNSVRLGDYSASFATLDEKAHALGIFNTLDLYRDIEI